MAAGEYVEFGEVAERSNATDCKSVALVASEVRILPSPPVFAAVGRHDVVGRDVGLPGTFVGSGEREGGSNSAGVTQW